MVMTSLLVATSVVALEAFVPSKMQGAMATTPSCSAPDFECLKVVQTSVPTPKSGQALVQVSAGSVSPSDYKMLEACAPNCELRGVAGNDAAGTVVECPGCTRLKVGDTVWGAVGHSLAEFVTADEGKLGLIPANLNLTEAATIPEVGLTGVSCLKSAGAPWAGRKNLTVVVTSGAGGTGFLGIQLAKAYGATHIVTSGSPSSFDFLRSIGADTIVDYHEQDLFDFLPEDSVDIVYDNYGTEGTGDRAMPAIRKGGAYLMLPHGGCFGNQSQAYPCTAANPKEGVANINVITGDYFSDTAKVLASLDELKGFFEAGKIQTRVTQLFKLEETRAAFVAVAKGHVHGKVAVTIESGAVLV